MSPASAAARVSLKTDMQEVPRHSPRRLSLCCRWERNNDACGCLRWAALFRPLLCPGALRPCSAVLRPSDQHGAARTVSWRRGEGGGGGALLPAHLLKASATIKGKGGRMKRLNPVRHEGRKKKRTSSILHPRLKIASVAMHYFCSYCLWLHELVYSVSRGASATLKWLFLVIIFLEHKYVQNWKEMSKYRLFNFTNISPEQGRVCEWAWACTASDLMGVKVIWINELRINDLIKCIIQCLSLL